jgi:hypothetical protein
MLEFSQKGIAAIGGIRRYMQMAEKAFATLSNEEKEACFDFHLCIAREASPFRARSWGAC